MKTTIYCLGHGSALTLPKHGHSSYLIEHGEERILLDCGYRVPDALLEYGINPGSIDVVVASHNHADHVGGLERLLYWRKYLSKRGPLELAMGCQALNGWKAAQGHLATSIHEPDMVTMRPLFSRSERVESGNSLLPSPRIIGTSGEITIQALNTRHGGDSDNMPCYSFLIRVGDKKIFFSGDRIWRHTGDEAIFQAMGLADLVLHELECTPEPCGAHTHWTHVENIKSNAFSKFRWCHHACSRDGAAPDGFNLIFMGDKIEL